MKVHEQLIAPKGIACPLADKICALVARHLERAGLDPGLAACLHKPAGRVLLSEIARCRLKRDRRPADWTGDRERNADFNENTSGERVDPEEKLDYLTDCLLKPIAPLIEARALRQRLWLATRSAIKSALIAHNQMRDSGIA